MPFCAKSQVTLSIEKQKKSDVSVQTHFQQIQTMKDVGTLTDAFACGDTGKSSVSRLLILPQHTLGDCGEQIFNILPIPFLDNSVDLPAETESSNPY
ncbi:hypothetical protein AVEN_237085-1 [Araneus ventricosus]|uniref:Uncharacterized protein n=1 Tax=Araneus ventricosus TaxID=182803 RepID=A0A4Y2V9S7_ARAVE|nr:hypothetical protein AVEN_237085-1 [Araneus ventricosus]